MTAAGHGGRLVSDLTAETFAARIAGPGIGVRMGPFHTRMQVSVPAVQAELYRFYAAHSVVADDDVFSFHLKLVPKRGSSLLRHASVRFTVDGRRPHEDMPLAQALPVFEWGLNLVVALRCYNFLMLHAAVLERNGRAMLLPAAPGDGKSTLCAGLAFRGWRLFSDEFGLLRPGTRDMLPVPRPVALKNGSVDVIRAFAPAAEIGPLTRNTRKGDVAHLKPPADAVRRQHEPAPASLIVFPRWEAGAPVELEDLSPAEAFMRLAVNAFNYEMLGEAAFDTVRRLVEGARCFSLRYGDLEAAAACLGALADEEW
jgi:HprK-related kinase A